MFRCCPKILKVAEAVSQVHSDPAEGRVYLSGDTAGFVAGRSDDCPDVLRLAVVAQTRGTFDRIVDLLVSVEKGAVVARVDATTLDVDRIRVAHYRDLPEALDAEAVLLDPTTAKVYVEETCGDIDCDLILTDAAGTVTEEDIILDAFDTPESVNEYLTENYPDAVSARVVDSQKRGVFVWVNPNPTKGKTYEAQAYGYPDTKITVVAKDKYAALDKARNLIPGASGTVLTLADPKTGERHSGYAAKALSGDVKYTVEYRYGKDSPATTPDTTVVYRPATDSYQKVIQCIKTGWLPSTDTILRIKANSPNAAGIPGDFIKVA